jgi:hypothetical protein
VGVVALLWAWSRCNAVAVAVADGDMDGVGGREGRGERRELVLAQVFFSAAAESLLGPFPLRPARSSSDAHSSPSEIRQLNNILLIPCRAAVLLFLSSAEKEGREGDRDGDEATDFLTDSVDVPGDTPHVPQETPHDPQGIPHDPQGTSHEPQAGSHVPQD